MPENKLGESRRSHCIGNFGPGAIVEFRTGEAAVSVVIGGLDYWDRFAPPAGLNNNQITCYENVASQNCSLVDGFRLPPVELRTPTLSSKTLRLHSPVSSRLPVSKLAPMSQMQ